MFLTTLKLHFNKQYDSSKSSWNVMCHGMKNALCTQDVFLLYSRKKIEIIYDLHVMYTVGLKAIISHYPRK